MRSSAPIRAAGVLLCWLVLSGVARPADPQPYDVTLKPTGNDALDGALHDSANLVSLQKTAPAGGFALVERARQDVGRFMTALHSFGYYKATVDITIAGHKLDDPALPDLLGAVPANPPVDIEVAFDLGPQFHFGQILVQGAVPSGVAGDTGLTAGAPAMAAEVLTAQSRLLNAIRSAGYPLAKVDLPPAVLHPDQDLLDVTFVAASGPPASIGPITITGLKDMHEAYVRQRLLLHQGETFSPAALEKARQDLAAVGVFSVVRMDPAEALDPAGQLPIRIDVTERPLHEVDVGVAYSTDLGLNFTTGWHDRNLFGNAEQLNLTAGVLLGGNAETKPGYNVGAQFIKPDFLARDQSLELDLNAVKQSLQAYDQTALLEKVAINRKLSEHWIASIGLSGEQESIGQEDVTRHYNLVGLPVSLKYDSTNSLLDPTKGIRATVSVTPTEALGTPSAHFFIMQAAGSTYLDLSGNGHSVLALRGLVGEAAGVGVFGLPPDQRFYAGGSGTVRGFRFQTIGPHFGDNKPTGGTSVAAATIELRQRIIGNFGMAAFVDAGEVSASGFGGGLRIGAGVGARYYTPIGPIRVDVAVPVNKEPGGDSLELYIGIGQAF